MKARLIALACGFVIVAGCGAGGGTASSAPGSVSGGSVPGGASADSGGLAGAGAAGPVRAGGACAARGSAASVGTGALTGVQFVSAARGWAVGQQAILATTDGGTHWAAQLTGDLNLMSLDFISAADGWAVGTGSLLATTDGGRHWTRLPDPCTRIRSVHFISPAVGVAVTGGSNAGTVGAAIPYRGGGVLATRDGGRTWETMATPADAQTVCFSDAGHGWLGAGGRLYRSGDGGRDWTAVATPSGLHTGSQPPVMSVQCADGSAWALEIGADSAMSQQPHVAFQAGRTGATAVFAEQYFESPGGVPKAQSPGSIAGPFSSLSASAAVFIDSCPACGYGSAPWAVATAPGAGASGATLTRKGNVADINQPEAASFLSARAGWVAGVAAVYPASGGLPRQQQRIVATADGGKTWHLQYAGPWTTPG
jgi:photosystem II stability/assembly factor-like uncharacterized protein